MYKSVVTYIWDLAGSCQSSSEKYFGWKGNSTISSTMTMVDILWNRPLIREQTLKIGCHSSNPLRLPEYLEYHTEEWEEAQRGG